MAHHLSSTDTLRRYALFGVVLLLHVAVFLALSDLIIFQAPVVADVFDRVQVPKPVDPPPPLPSEPQPSLMPPSVNITPSAPAVVAQVITAFNPALTIPQLDTTRLALPNMPISNPTLSAGTGTGLTGMENRGAVTGDISQLSNGLKDGTPNDTLGAVAFSQATWNTVGAVQKIEDGYPNVNWALVAPSTVEQASLKRDPVTHRTNILDNPQCMCVGDPTACTLIGTLHSIQHAHAKNLVLILDLTDPSNRNEELAKAVEKILRDNGVRLFIIPITMDGTDTAIHGSVYQILSSYVTESGGVIYFPAGVPRDYDTNQQP